MVLLETAAVLISLSTIIGFYNFFTATKLTKSRSRHQPFISVLIPARNEENNLPQLLQSLLKQTYPHFEVIICDDNSEDKTLEIIQSYTGKSKQIAYIQGKKLPPNWTGKNWACHQLSQKARGSLYLFLDADVLLEPEALESAVALMERKKTALLSCFPCQKMKTVGEWLIVPLLDWLLLSFIPMDLVYRTKNNSFSVAIGQFILIRKSTYYKINGHEGIKDKITEDVYLSKRVKLSGNRILAARSKGLVKCRMYGSFKESLDGLSRSFYLGSHLSPAAYILSVIGFVFLFFFPVAMYIINVEFLYMLIPLLLQRICTSIIACQNFIFNLILLPIHGILAVVTCSRSVYLALNNKIVWKGRKLLSRIGR